MTTQYKVNMPTVTGNETDGYVFNSGIGTGTIVTMRHDHCDRDIIRALKSDGLFPRMHYSTFKITGDRDVTLVITRTLKGVMTNYPVAELAKTSGMDSW